MNLFARKDFVDALLQPNFKKGLCHITLDICKDLLAARIIFLPVIFLLYSLPLCHLLSHS